MKQIRMNGNKVTNISELREYFNIKKIFKLQRKGTLTRWLRECGYNEEADALDMCDFSERNSENERSVCSALGVDYSRCLSRLEKALFVSNREFLLKYTDDITVLNYSDGLARNQKDLAALIAYGAKVIVLCNSEFFIPLFKCGITYYCVGSVRIVGSYAAEQYHKSGIIINNYTFGSENRICYLNRTGDVDILRKALEIEDMQYFYDCGTLAESLSYTSRADCQNAKCTAIKALYDGAIVFIDEILYRTVDYYSKQIESVYDNIVNDELRLVLKCVSCEATEKIHEQIEEVLKRDRCFQIDLLPNFYDMVGIREINYHNCYLFVPKKKNLFFSNETEYRYKSLVPVADELKRQVDRIALTAIMEAHRLYLGYVEQMVKISEIYENKIIYKE